MRGIERPTFIAAIVVLTVAAAATGAGQDAPTVQAVQPVQPIQSIQPAAAVSGLPTTLTLATYNLHIAVPMGHEIGVYRVALSDIQTQSDVVTSLSADIVSLQEVDSEFGLTLPPRRQRSSMIPMPRLMSHLAGLPTYMFGSAQDDIRYPSDNAGYVEWGTAEHWRNNGAPHGEVGNAILSRLAPAVPPENLALPKKEGKERRACLRAELLCPGAPGGTVIVYSTHLQHDDAGSRSDQMKAILDRARRDTASGTLVFILGDLNHVAPRLADRADAAPAAPAGAGNAATGMASTTPLEDPCTLAIVAGFTDLAAHHAASRNQHAAPTFPAVAPERRIDYIFCSHPLPCPAG